MRCVQCWTDFSMPKGIVSNVCPACSKPKELGSFRALDYTTIDGYGKVLTSRIGELRRRVIIDNKALPGSYFCGRMGENGKIQERSPDYRG